jgi:hypothetical protein
MLNVESGSLVGLAAGFQKEMSVQLDQQVYVEIIQNARSSIK